MDTQWHYVAGNGCTVGPVSESALHQMVQVGQVLAGTMIWREGQDGWKAYATVFNVPSPAHTAHASKPGLTSKLSGKDVLLYSILPLLFLGFMIYRTGDGASSASAAVKPVEPAIPDRFDAQVTCETFVKRKLKAPATAEFAPSHELTISGEGDGPWKVTGYVDAENSFGAKLRSRYYCEMHFEGTTAVADQIQLID